MASEKVVSKVLETVSRGKDRTATLGRFNIWDSEGVCVQKDEVQEKSPQLAWKDVIKATAFKQDLFSTDRICLFFATVAGTGLEVHEDMNGWSKLTEELPAHLPGCKPWSAWFFKVMTPAFEPNVTEIFLRATNMSAEGGQS